MVCTSCFNNYGIRQTSLLVKKSNIQKQCDNCGSIGHPLNLDELEDIMRRFFVNGSIPPEVGGPAPVYQFNKYHSSKDIIFLTDIDKDLQLLSEKLNVGLFHYGPPLWRLGYTAHYQALVFDKVEGEKRSQIWNQIIQRCEESTYNVGDVLYRVRTGNKMPPSVECEFDTPPVGLIGEGRFNSSRLPILYCATDVETCMHETRATLADYIVVAELLAIKPLKLLNLSKSKSTGATEFEQVDRMLQRLSYAGKNEYSICQELALEIQKYGYDGFISLSYFGQAHKSELYNISLFGYPLKEKKLSLKSVNRLIIDSVSYEYRFGPTNDNHFMDKSKLSEIGKKMKEFTENPDLNPDDFNEVFEELGVLLGKRSGIPV
ncbi:RES family NAD+ phosphorylase [Candidatus Accumulibacter sp. ACC012]|jgi:hypothetical protein|uniref:RES family NAD+ phosphorylase n=1 Tax=Candidatus Accumulibacter sp. ACC012 TaxID=2823332 RepID=UPI0025C68FAB|nr:RES family NAD+ phosphorylase [Candidatus Accumulibacter sp. ACC012]